MENGSPPENMLLRFRRNTRARYVGKWFEKGAKRLLISALTVFFPKPRLTPLPDVHGVKKILIVRPNFRIGNSLMGTPLIKTVHERFPDAEVDYLAANTTACLLENFPLRRVITVSRHYTYNPFTLARLLRTLRKERYDAVIDAGRGSLTSALLSYVTGARYRIGDGRWANGLLNVPIGVRSGVHAYDDAATLASAFAPCTDGRPQYIVSQIEQTRASDMLRSLGVYGPTHTRPFLAVFVGGHLSKRWNNEQWLALLSLIPPLATIALFLGPEEQTLGADIGHLMLANVFVVPVLSLRALASLSAQATLALSPDTGTMHMAVALGVPVIAVLQTEASLRYVPKVEGNLWMMRPTPSVVVEALKAHPRWPMLIGATDASA